MMTIKEAKENLLELNNKELNESEHEAIRIATRILSDTANASDTCKTCYNAGQIVFGYKLRKSILNGPDDFYITKQAILNFIDEQLDGIDDDDV